MTPDPASVSWLRSRDGNGSWRATPPHRPVVTDLLVAFLACLLGLVLLVGLVVAGRHAMCTWHADDPVPLNYCHDTEPTR